MGTEVFGIVLLMDNHVLWSADADPNLLSLNTHHRHRDVVADYDGFADAACEDEHRKSRPWSGVRPLEFSILTRTPP